MNIARNIPILVAFYGLSTGNLPVAIEMKNDVVYSKDNLGMSMLIGDPSIRI
jgi:hypothetical protein